MPGRGASSGVVRMVFAAGGKVSFVHFVQFFVEQRSKKVQ
jgi:hypothetical protein